MERPVTMKLPRIVSLSEWKAAHDRLLEKEKAHTRAGDALAAERRRLPMVRVQKGYFFEGPNGEVSLLDLFEGRRQLIVYHFMFAPGVDGWPEAGCPGCSMVGDQVADLAHLHARDTSLVFISRGPYANLERYRERMGWDIPWYSSGGTDFNDDMGATTEHGETHLLSVFVRDDSTIYRTYFTGGRGVEALGPVWSFLDLTPLGRQETWEDSPEGYPQTAPYQWWRRHDEYEEAMRESRR